MSLMSMLNAATARSSAHPSLGESGLASAVQKAILDAKASSAGVPAESRPIPTPTVAISAAAQMAAAAKVDDAKDFTALSKEVRSALNQQYGDATAAGRDVPSPDVSRMSGRAIAAIALNKTGDFSRDEIFTAKGELNRRNREAFLSATGSNHGAGGLVTYSRQLVSQYDVTSSEEREARGWTPQTRTTSASYVQKATAPSLWDMLG